MAKNKIHVFWSGNGAKEEAQRFASDNGCLVLENTHIAEYISQVLKKQRRDLEKKGRSSRDIWYQKELPEWEKLSRAYAESSPHSTVQVFIDVSYTEPEDMRSTSPIGKNGDSISREYREKPWLNDFYYGWTEEDFIKFRSCFPNGQIPKSMKECSYDRKRSVLHRVEHPILKEQGKELVIHYVNKGKK